LRESTFWLLVFAAQAPGVSPASDASCAMEYSCSLPSTPAAKEQAQPLAQAPSAEADEPPPAAAFEGWFAKCRWVGGLPAAASAAVSRSRRSGPAAAEVTPPCRSPPPGCVLLLLLCRGCGCMTAHEKFISHADVPFCRR
jgi:hypothetical protein